MTAPRASGPSTPPDYVVFVSYGSVLLPVLAPPLGSRRAVFFW